MDKSDRKNNKPHIKFLVYWVGTKCTQRCKLCSNLIPFMEQKSYNALEIIKDLKILYQNCTIKNFQLQGGEPFTHPEIIKIIDFVGTLNIPTIKIATNGTVHLKDNVLKALKRNPKVQIRISNYECNKEAREKFIKQLTDNDIPYKMYNFMYGDNSWFSTGGINEIEHSDSEAKKAYSECDEKGCLTFADGKLVACGKIPAIKEIYKCYDKRPFDEVNIRKIRYKLKCAAARKIRKSVKDFIDNISLYKYQCKYCVIDSQKYPAAEQLSIKELNELKKNIQR